MAALCDAGTEVHVLVLGEGVGARYEDDARPDNEVGVVAAELDAAAEIVGAIPHRLGLPDNRFDSVDLLDVVHGVERVKGEIQPDLVFTHHGGDLNVDHRVAFNAALTAFRPLPGDQRATMLAFETLSSTEWAVPPVHAPFSPNWFEDASSGLERKVKAMAAYEHELREWPHPRSLEGIRTAAARWGSVVGLDAAEPFCLLRHVGVS